MYYKEELLDKDLKSIMKKYASIQNRVLVDYKQFRDEIVAQLKKININYTFAGSASMSDIFAATIHKPNHDLPSKNNVN